MKIILLFVGLLLTSTAQAFHPHPGGEVTTVSNDLSSWEQWAPYVAERGDSSGRWTDWALRQPAGREWVSGGQGRTTRSLIMTIALVNNQPAVWQALGWKAPPFPKVEAWLDGGNWHVQGPNEAAFGLRLGKPYWMPIGSADWFENWQGLIDIADHALKANLSVLEEVEEKIENLLARPGGDEMLTEVDHLMKVLDGVLSKTVPGDAANQTVFAMKAQLTELGRRVNTDLLQKLRQQWKTEWPNFKTEMETRLAELEGRVDAVENVNTAQDERLDSHRDWLGKLVDEVNQQKERIEALELRQKETLDQLPGQLDRLIGAIEEINPATQPTTTPAPATPGTTP